MTNSAESYPLNGLRQTNSRGPIGFLRVHSPRSRKDPFNLPRLSARAIAFAVLALPVISAAQQNGDSFITRYQARVAATQAAQPHWVTPLVTVTPRLEQEIRADFVRQRNSQLFDTWNLGNSKGLELIPERHIELIFNIPPFLDHSQPRQNDGFGDVSFLAKYRLLSRNEEHGNEIVTAFLGATVPTGKNGNGSCCSVVTPTLAIGKGFGQFAVTSTSGASLPISNSIGLGHTITLNNAIQYRVGKISPARFLWPEIEFNSSFYEGGANDGRSQAFVTPGIIVGRIPLHNRTGLTFGAGEQMALTRLHTYNHSLVLTVRIPF